MSSEVALIVMIPGVLMVAVLLLRRWTERTKAKWPCRLDWHHYHKDNGEEILFDGASRVRVCSRCGNTLIQDSQGNWFSTKELK